MDQPHTSKTCIPTKKKIMPATANDGSRIKFDENLRITKLKKQGTSEGKSEAQELQDQRWPSVKRDGFLPQVRPKCRQWQGSGVEF